MHECILKHSHAGCRPGQYWDTGAAKCLDCRLGFYCPGGVHDPVNNNNDLGSKLYPCGAGLTTRIMRAQSSSACVNMPGYKYVPAATPSAAPSATECSAGFFSLGMSKQLECTACPPGYTTLKDKRKAPTDCGAALAPMLTIPTALPDQTGRTSKPGLDVWGDASRGWAMDTGQGLLCTHKHLLWL
jgi:hypothetical protein